MNVFRPLPHLMLVVALAAVCPLRCQADAARALGVSCLTADACDCCPVEQSESPAAPHPEECTDCVCDGAVDGPRVATVDLSADISGDLPAVGADELAALSAALRSLDARPAAPDGAELRLLIASLLI